VHARLRSDGSELIEVGQVRQPNDGYFEPGSPWPPFGQARSIFLREHQVLEIRHHANNRDARALFQ